MGGEFNLEMGSVVFSQSLAGIRYLKAIGNRMGALA
jgi:hypothetical protein